MPRGRKQFHGLKKIRVRQTWNKYNLYNLSRLEQPRTGSRTFFQQKWTAKAQARAYHGEHIREGQWTKMFSRYIPAVVPLDAAELAKDDGAIQGAGRGSGKDVKPLTRDELDELKKNRALPKPAEPTPYMSMTFYPQERRLDTAIFRAMFASSARQARQFVVHGFVKVNGKKMHYPGYLLNPGDMFSVDPEMVLFATGTPHHAHRELKAPGSEGVWFQGEYIPPPGGNTGKVNRSAKSKPVEEPEEQIVDEVAELEEEETAEATESAEAIESAETIPASAQLLIHKALVALRKDVKNTERLIKDLTAKRKQDLRALAKDLRTAISKSNSTSGKVTVDMQKHWEKWFYDILKAVPGNVNIPASVAYLESVVQEGEEVKPEKKEGDALSKESGLPGRGVTKIISEHLEKLKNYPNSKPRWFPRHYMSAFAFIPRYLEVNQNVCSAVYLRHPVARPGLAEVPSPFGPETGLLAFQWYLRRR